MVLMFLLLGCPSGKESPADSPADSTHSTTTADSCSLGECNSCNEECAPRACNGSGVYMLPGANCLNCHATGTGAGALPLGAGGTVFVDKEGSSGAGGKLVRLTDANGKVWETATVDNGNFAFEDGIVWPATAEVDGRAMKEQAPVGACNSCHSCSGEAGGKLYAP